MTRQSEISMGLITNIAIAEAAGNITSILTGGDVGGIMQTVTQQLGLGLMLSTLLITVPPMAGMWFNGVMASYSGYNAIAGWNGGQPATPPGMNSQSQVEQRANQVSERMIRDQNQLSAPTSNSIVNIGYTNSPNTGSDHIKNYQNNLYQRSERLVSADSKSSDDKKTKT